MVAVDATDDEDADAAVAIAAAVPSRAAASSAVYAPSAAPVSLSMRPCSSPRRSCRPSAAAAMTSPLASHTHALTPTHSLTLSLTHTHTRSLSTRECQCVDKSTTCTTITRRLSPSLPTSHLVMAASVALLARRTAPAAVARVAVGARLRGIQTHRDTIVFFVNGQRVFFHTNRLSPVSRSHTDAACQVSRPADQIWPSVRFSSICEITVALCFSLCPFMCAHSPSSQCCSREPNSAAVKAAAAHARSLFPAAIHRTSPGSSTRLSMHVSFRSAQLMAHLVRLASHCIHSSSSHYDNITSLFLSVILVIAHTHTHTHTHTPSHTNTHHHTITHHYRQLNRASQ
jgi:hypothetical protein